MRSGAGVDARQVLALANTPENPARDISDNTKTAVSILTITKSFRDTLDPGGGR